MNPALPAQLSMIPKSPNFKQNNQFKSNSDSDDSLNFNDLDDMLSDIKIPTKKDLKLQPQ